MANDTGSGKSAADIAFDECIYDRKYLLLSVPDFDVDPVEGDGARRMTSYLRLGTVPDDWKSLPGAELELAVHADYGLGGGREGLPIGQVVPGEVLPSDPIDARYLPPTLDNLAAVFLEEVQAALDAAHELPAVVRWADDEKARVAASQKLLDENRAQAELGKAGGAGDGGKSGPGGEGADQGKADAATAAEPPLPKTVTPADFVRFLLLDGEPVTATLETRLQGVAVGSPTSPLDDDGAATAVDAMNLKGLVEIALRDVAADAVPWTILAVTPFATARTALVADAARRAGARLMEMLTDSPDALLEDGTPKYSPFVDDQRYRGVYEDDANYISHEDRHKHSKHLHTRGGWRDHSDGNRITTTYGDKIEVIRGNYKLMVLGRQGDPGASNIVDYSGQITQSDDNMLLRVEWVQEDEVFNWETVNENIVESEKKSGRAYSWWYGPEKIDITGSEDPVEPTSSNPLGRNGDDKSRANPHITSRTWARWIKDYTGSAKLPVGSTYSETWVDETEERTTVTRGTVSTTTIGAGTIETTTIGAGTISTTTVGGGTMETTTVGGAAIALTAIGGAQVEITGVVGAIVGVTASLANIEVSAHAVHVEAAAVGLHAEFKATGIQIDLSATGISIEGSVSGKEYDISPEEDETMIIKKQTYGSYTRTTSIDVLNYVTSSESGTSKNMSLTALRVVAASISLG